MAKQKLMSPEQFGALFALMRLKSSPSSTGARMVLVYGVSAQAAAVSVGISVGAVRKSIRTCRRGQELAMQVAGK